MKFDYISISRERLGLKYLSCSDYGEKIYQKTIGPFNDVNILIGSNNSGKSRMARNIIQAICLDKVIYIESEKIMDFDDRTLTNYYTNIRNMGFDKFPLLKTLEKNSFHNLATEEKRTLFLEIIHHLLSLIGFYIDNSYDSYEEIKPNYQKLSNKVLTYLVSQKLIILKEALFSNIIYIPVMRSTRPYEKGKDVLKERFFKDYKNIDRQYNSHEILYTGQMIFADIERKLLGSRRDRELVKEFENYLSIKFFHSKTVTIIPRKDDDVIYLQIGEEEDIPIYNLGDGIQSIIMILYPLFLYKDSASLCIIEEPEINLHPGLQKKLINTLFDFSDKKQFIILTHSNNILGELSYRENVSIFKFEKVEKEKKEPYFTISKSSTEDLEILDLLGVTNSSVLLSNCVIWVEGITDRLYIREFLNKYQMKHFKREVFFEGIHYSFLEYSGDNLSHWSFLNPKDKEFPNIDYKRITNRLFVIVDADINSSKSEAKKERNNMLKKILLSNFLKLKVNEIENILHEKIIRKIIKEYELYFSKETEDFSYVDNKILYKEYKSKQLGNYIDDKLGDDKKRQTYSKSGTVFDKGNFCKKACIIMRNESYTNCINNDIEQLCKRIFTFININNNSILEEIFIERKDRE